MTTTKAVDAITSTLIDGNNPGVTTSATVGQPLPRTGYLVGGEIEPLVITRGERVALAQPWHRVADWVAEHRALVAFTPGLFFGSWQDQDGTVYYDVSRVVYELDRAIDLGVDRLEIAIWDIANGTEIALGPIVDGRTA